MGEVNLDNVLRTQASRTGDQKPWCFWARRSPQCGATDRGVFINCPFDADYKEILNSHFSRASRDRSNIWKEVSQKYCNYLFMHGSLNIKTRQPAFDMATAQSVVDQRILAHSGSPWPRYASAKSLVSDQMTTGSGTEERNLQARQNYRLIFRR